MNYCIILKHLFLLIGIGILSNACSSDSNRQSRNHNEANGSKADVIVAGTNQPSNQLIYWDSVKIEPIPFTYLYPIDSITSYISSTGSVDEFFKYEQTPKIHQELNKLFSPLTYLSNREYQNSHPSKQQAYFFKRLADVGKNRLLLFVYHDIEAQGQLPTIELQIFDKGNKLIDKMIVADAVSYEDCKWYRSFTYSEDNIITLTDRDNCYNMEKEGNAPIRAVTFLYKTKLDGKIVRYFKKPSGEVVESLNDFGDKELKGKYISKGKVGNHYKQGLWEEVEPDRYGIDGTDSNAGLIKAFGYYKNGEKDGEWLYYLADEDSNYPDYPRLAQRYKEGKLLEQTTEADQMDQYQLLKELEKRRQK